MNEWDSFSHFQFLLNSSSIDYHSFSLIIYSFPVDFSSKISYYMVMKTITKKELIEKMNAVKGSTILSVDVLTTPRMRKTDNPYIGATKVVTLSGIANFDYQNSVNNQLVRENKEPEFVAQKRTWGERQENWIVHNGNYYLQLKVQGSSTPVYRFNDEVIEKTVLEPFLQEASKPHTQDAIEHEIVVRDIKLENIRCIRAFGEEYLVV